MVDSEQSFLLINYYDWLTCVLLQPWFFHAKEATKAEVMAASGPAPP